MTLPTLEGHLAVFNAFTEINNPLEGQFLEQIAPGAFKKTFADNRKAMRVLFQHGQDPWIGENPLGRIEELREDEHGAYYRVPLLDTAYNRDLTPGLDAGVYGTSFRFQAIREAYDPQPGRSKHNPFGLAERTLQEVRVVEFGPVSFPAYDGATAGLRSTHGGPRMRTAGRVEILDRGIPDGRYRGEPSTLRRLRGEARTSARAAQLLQTIESGKKVQIVWGAIGGPRDTRVKARRTTPTPPRNYWSLGGRARRPVSAWKL